MTDCGCDAGLDPADQVQRRVLGTLLAVNGVMFTVEVVAGLVAESSGLVADSLDMLADATVYGIALYAVGRSRAARNRAATLSGVFQILLATGVGFDVLRRAVVGSEPVSTWMITVGILALAANLTCLALLAKHRDGEIHMRASWIFSVNDVLANLGVITGGVLVLATGSRWPDLAIGAVVTLLVLRGGLRILHEARTNS